MRSMNPGMPRTPTLDAMNEPSSRTVRCAPRYASVLDQARGVLRVERNHMNRALVERFARAEAHDAQVGQQDLGLSLCARSGRRLSSENLEGITCPECRQLLQPLVLSRPGVPTASPAGGR